MANTWFRLYSEFATDPKIQALPEALQRRYVMLLCLKCNGDLDNVTERNGSITARNGKVTACNGSVTTKIISVALRITEEETKETHQTLIDFGLVDEDWNISGWEKRQYISDLRDPTNAERQRRYREKKRNGNNGESNGGVTGEKRPDTDTDTDINTEGEQSPPSGSPEKTPNCPHEALVNLYHEVLPNLREVRVLNDTRRGYLRSLWKQHPDLGWWRRYFHHVSQSGFLCGRVDGRDGKPPFVADLEWITKPSNFAKITEGKYHPQGGA